MSVQINSFDLAPILIQTGYGIPDHISPLGSEYTDLYTAFKYYNTNGLAYWVQYLDSSFSGGSASIFTGGTVTGPTYFLNGVTANTISATTYLGLPIDVNVTGGTYTAGTATFSNNTGGTFNVTGFSSVSDFVPYSGAVKNVDLGLYGLKADYLSVNTGSTYVATTGDITWNQIDGTYNMGLYNDVTLQVGQEENMYGKALSAISNGDIVMFAGSQGDHVLFAKAEQSVINNSHEYIIGVATQDFTTNQFGYVTTIGKVRGLNTIAYSGGTVLYFNSTGSTAGSLTNIEPPAPYANITIAAVLRSHATQGILLVRPSFRFPFKSLDDVQITNIQNNDIVQYSSSLGYFVNTNTPKFTSLSATTISATTYYNLPITADTFTTGFSYSNNTFTINRNQGLSALTASINTMTGLTVNGNLTVTGTTFKGNGTFTKSGYAIGDVLLDNSATDTPGVLFYYGNNSNYGIDSYNGSFDILSGQLFRITNKLNESGGAVKMAIDTSGNVVATGFVKANAWRAGQVIQDVMLSNTEVTVSTTSIATSTSDTDFVTYSYTPLSSSSYLVIHYHLADYDATSGGGNDSWISRIKVDGAEITYAVQSTVNGFRTGVLFPLTGRYTNSNTTAKSIVVACRRITADDSITITNTATSMWLRITEIAR